MAYAPYSHFKVGSAILMKSGEVYTGCNIESNSLTFNLCAERNAISSAIVKEHKPEIDTVAIYVDTDQPAAPCGLCRQLIFEFGQDARVVSFGNSNEIFDSNIKTLLPDAFDFNDFKK